MALRSLSLCAGVGGLDLALRSLGVVSVGYVERDAYAASVLVARMEDAALDCAPIWSDLSTFDADPWRGRVDLVSAGYPCQPFSQAGKRLGEADERHLWPHVFRIVRELAPPLVLLENVAGHVRLGLRDVLSDLASVWFHAEWGLFSAAEAGAPHRRERLFVLAYRDIDGLRQLGSGWLLDGERAPLGDDADGCRGPHEGVVHPVQPGLQRGFDPWPGGWGGAPGPGQNVADSLRRGRHGYRLHERDWPRHVAAFSRGGGPGPRPAAWPPGPQDQVAWARVLERDPLLAPALPAVRGVAHGPAGRVDANRTDRLRCLGNGAVPAQVCLAVVELARRALTYERIDAHEAGDEETK